LAGNDIANCFVSAKEGYKVVWQAGGKARFIYLPPGLMLAQVKFSLIDLELLAGNAEDNKAQAPERVAA
jgi:hypothetical protein